MWVFGTENTGQGGNEMSTKTSEQHTERYGDVTRMPADVLVEVATFVSREWGGHYQMGFVGVAVNPAAAAWSGGDGTTYVFQVKASDGSRFAVGTTLWGSPFELVGSDWLAWLRDRGVEATVRGCTA